MKHALKDKTVVVIGGSSGMGLAVAKKSLLSGARVVIASRSRDKLKAAAAQIGGDVHWQVADTTDEASVSDLFERLGAVDHLVIPGSSVKTGTLRDMPLAEGLYTMQSKFWGPYLCAKYARINPEGSITLFSGILSRRPGRNDTVLASVNAAVEAMGRALAKDLAPVRVNVISPGMTAGTGAYLKMPESAREEMFTAIARRLPAGRVGRPEDIADAALMLMANGFITGIVLDVDGGGLIA
ncbi:MAG: SDR family oxidoreductase [Deltaproteobacteria bacterium]|nr:SDR family oxidoreductase [Deltaproteobacteria bacterium]